MKDTLEHPTATAALAPQHIARARSLAQSSGRHILEVLEEISSLSPEAFTLALGQLLHYPVLTMQELYALQADFSALSFTEASQLECVALRNSQGELCVAFANPFDSHVRGKVELLLQSATAGALLPPWFLLHRKDLAAFLARFEETMRAMDGIASSDEQAERSHTGIEDLSIQAISADTSAVVKLVRSTLYDALKAGASDIHLESDTRGLNIKYRVDGVLNMVAHMAGLEQAEQAISRIKVMAELDIAERRVPQDGRFKVMVQGREVDMRVSIMPSVHGEDAVLRILDRQAVTQAQQNSNAQANSNAQPALSLEVLGFEPAIMQSFRQLAEEPYGMLLVTGPTGSGKTTTLYGIISEINHGQDKIITIEDPVEYQLPGVLQIPVNEKKGLTFARGLRSILRHDPDKIMVGEIRDAETAQIAVQSALTGHLVLTTVHANNVFDVIGRFSNMQVDPYSFVSAMNGILAQRLVRIICPHCVQEARPDAALLAKSGLHNVDIAHYQFKQGLGCGQCNGTGYKGRKAIAELLCFNDEIRELIVSREPVRKVKQAARENGTLSMREAVLLLVSRGETTLQEANRVTSLI